MYEISRFLGKGVGSDEPTVPAQKFMSSGFVRTQNLSNVVVMPKGVTAASSPAHALQMRAAESVSVGSLALAETTVAYVYDEPAPAAADLRAKARLQGYEGDSCGECGNFTLVRNGTCLKCNTCGSTSGCS